MSARVLAYGDRDLLVELDDGGERAAFHAALQSARPAGVTEVVPAARTILIRLSSPNRLVAVADELRALTVDRTPAEVVNGRESLEITVRYEGADLEEVAAGLGVSVETLLEQHQRARWRVEFAGFSPGFGYLASPDWPYDVPRRSSPRTRIPAGAVALAGRFTGAYPQASPGGWQLIGRTDLILWDPAREEPALLVPGRTVRFVAERRT